ncbi:MAG TPA: hypothetical protein VHW60_02820 [Caulobacteraceae bacterium]|jgi:hypothetical protein|nr:hypothetical protein [Caulobacteraceae bacterium]
MPIWAIVLLGLAALALIPIVALAGRGAGKRMRGNLALAAMLLGLGEPFDPPSKHLVEASHKDEEESEAAGAPPRPDA